MNQTAITFLVSVFFQFFFFSVLCFWYFQIWGADGRLKKIPRKNKRKTKKRWQQHEMQQPIHLPVQESFVYSATKPNQCFFLPTSFFQPFPPHSSNLSPLYHGTSSCWTALLAEELHTARFVLPPKERKRKKGRESKKHKEKRRNKKDLNTHKPCPSLHFVICGAMQTFFHTLAQDASKCFGL